MRREERGRSGERSDDEYMTDNGQRSKKKKEKQSEWRCSSRDPMHGSQQW